MERFITLYVTLVVALGRKLRRNSTFPWWVDTGISWSRYNRVRKMTDSIVLILCFVLVVNNGRKL